MIETSGWLLLADFNEEDFETWLAGCRGT